MTWAVRRERENVDVWDRLPSDMDTAKLPEGVEVGGTRQRKELLLK
jgi:hypothetical protein